MTAPELAGAVRAAVDAWQQATTVDQRTNALASPGALSTALGDAVLQAMIDAGVDAAAVRQAILAAPFVLLAEVFDPADLPETPQWFTPMPDSNGTQLGRAAALATHGFLGIETVSYASENSGELFVSLTAIPGDGKFARKSQGGLRGHTDAVSFPFNGETDGVNPRIAPSPDLVTLVGLRNPKAVPTTVMVLDEALAKLSAEDVLELKKAQFSIGSQTTFIEGLRDILGDVHTAVYETILKDAAIGTIVRFSHTNVSPTEPDLRAEEAIKRLAMACGEVAKPVAIAPGDVLLVSNRLCLHGRAEVGADFGGQSRWLMRTYALDTSELDDNRRHLGDLPPHVLFP